ncbi:MAG: helix-turn-helix domain-containing protein [Anaerolineae bacterium]|nr:helix-turn-helix domain-containing protein [Anaerolineae bacterium]
MSEKQFFSTEEAAEYLGLAVATVKYHIYESKALAPDATIGRTLMFTRDTLDQFQATRRKPGRPPATDSDL